MLSESENFVTQVFDGWNENDYKLLREVHELAAEVVSLVMYRLITLEKSFLVGESLYLGGKQLYVVISANEIGYAADLSPETYRPCGPEILSELEEISRVLQVWIEFAKFA